MTPRSALGRGLEALLPQEAKPSVGSPLRQVLIADVAPNPRQPRREFAADSLDELAASIAQLGVLQPIIVRETDSGFQVVAGERRLRAARAAGLDEVPAVVVETDQRGALERALVENIQRADLNPIEEASAYKQLLVDGGLTQEELSRRIGRNRATIANSLRLLELPVDIQRMLVEGSLSAGHGRALLALEGSPFLTRLARRVMHEGLSVRETEELVRRYREMSGDVALTSGRRSIAEPAAAAEIRHRLADALQTRVRVEMGKRKGKLVIDFVSLDELDRIARILLGGAQRGEEDGATASK